MSLKHHLISLKLFIKSDKTVAENNKSVMIAVGFFCRSLLYNSEDCFR